MKGGVACDSMRIKKKEKKLFLKAKHEYRKSIKIYSDDGETLINKNSSGHVKTVTPSQRREKERVYEFIVKVLESDTQF